MATEEVSEEVSVVESDLPVAEPAGEAAQEAEVPQEASQAAEVIEQAEADQTPAGSAGVEAAPEAPAKADD